MHPALWQLLWFEFRSAIRGLFRSGGNWRRLFLVGCMLLFACFPMLLRAFTDSEVMQQRYGQGMAFWATLYLAATWLTASADRGLVMRPAEVHFIIGGPFTTFGIITHNLIKLGLRASISASVLALIAMAYLPSFMSAWVGMWLLISVSLLLGMAVSLAARRSQIPAIPLLRRILTVVVLTGLLSTVVESFQKIRSEGESPTISLVASQVSKTTVGRQIFPYVDWMFRPIRMQKFFPDTLQLIPARLGVLGLLAGCIYWLGSSYSEASAARTDRSIAKRQSAERAGSAPATAWTRRLRLPIFKVFGKPGAIVWMQSLHTLRILPKYMTFTLAIVMIVLVIPLLLDRQKLAGWSGLAWYVGLVAYADFLLLLQLPTGFLSPQSQRELLKSLPIATWKVTLGQLAGASLPVGCLHCILTGLFLVLYPGEKARLLAVAVATLPVAFVIVANINLLGIWNIIKPRALQQRDPLAAGRAMISVWVFFATLLPMFVFAAVGALLGSILSAGSFWIVTLGASSGVLASTSLYIGLLAWSFDRWQPMTSERNSQEVEHNE